MEKQALNISRYSKSTSSAWCVFALGTTPFEVVCKCECEHVALSGLYKLIKDKWRELASSSSLASHEIGPVPQMLDGLQQRIGSTLTYQSPLLSNRLKVVTVGRLTVQPLIYFRGFQKHHFSRETKKAASPKDDFQRSEKSG
jgi:hypothetical protein